MIIVKTAPKLNLSHLLLNKRFGRQSGRQSSSDQGASHNVISTVLGAVKSLPIVYQMTSQSGVLREKVVDKPKFKIPYTSLFYSSTYLRRTVPYFYVLQKRVFCVKTRNSFLAHHGGRRLWPLPSPMARRHPNQAHRRNPHTMGDAACAWFGLNLPGGRVVSTPPPNASAIVPVSSMVGFLDTC